MFEVKRVDEDDAALSIKISKREDGKHDVSTNDLITKLKVYVYDHANASLKHLEYNPTKDYYGTKRIINSLHMNKHETNMPIVELFFDFDTVSMLSLIRQRRRILEFYHFHDFESALNILVNKKDLLAICPYETILNNNDITQLCMLKKSLNANNITFKIRTIRPSDALLNEKQLNIELDNSVIACTIDLGSITPNSFRERCARNVKRAIKENTHSAIFYKQDVPNIIMQEFYNSCVISRINLGYQFGSKGKLFEHPGGSFVMRKHMIREGKMLLVRTQHQEKISYVLALLSDRNAFYQDGGYNIRKYPFTSHYAQYICMKALEKLNCPVYSLGAIENKELHSAELKDSRDTVDYYKLSFCKEPCKVYNVT